MLAKTHQAYAGLMHIRPATLQKKEKNMKFAISSAVKTYETYDDAVTAAKKALVGAYSRDEYFIHQVVASVAKPLPECVVTKF